MLSRYAYDNNRPMDTKGDSGNMYPEIRDSPYITEPELEKLAEQLLIWARLDDSIKISDFLSDKRITSQEFREWQEKSAYLKRANQLAKMAVGNRRERRGLEGKYNSGIVLRTMPLYDEEYATLCREQMASSKDNATGSQQTIVVLRDKYPETDAVKVKSLEGTE